MPSPADRLRSTDVDLAVERLAAGGLVAIPTETVYGLAADASRPDAVARIYAIKGRPTDHPLIVHVTGVQALGGWVADLSGAGERLADTCWPGPLTMLLPRGPRAGDHLTGGRSTIGVRVPAHHMTLDLLERFGEAVAAPSANRFGKVSPTTADHVIADLGALLDPDRDLVLDGGACHVGVESTIVDLSVDPPQVLRTGAITEQEIERLLERPVGAAAGPSRASGMLRSHYAPDCAVLLADDRIEAMAIAGVERSRGRRVEVLDRTQDLVASAQLLYADLRAADQRQLDAIVVVMPPAEGIGHAVRDRLRKAAASDPAADRDRPSRDD